MHGEVMPQHIADTAHDGQSKTEPLVTRAGGFDFGALAAEELVEDEIDLLLVDTRPRIPNLDVHVVAAASRRQKYAAAGRIADGIGHQVTQDAGKEKRIRGDDQLGRADAQVQAFGGRQRDEFTL